jgi:hypothetical protein
MKHISEALRGDIGVENTRQPRRDGFMNFSGGGRHEKLAPDEFVFVSVVWQAMNLSQRPDFGFGRHWADESFLSG